MKNQHIFISFPTPYYFPQLDQPFINGIKNTNSGVPFAKFYNFSNYSLTVGNQIKLSTCGRSGFSAAFQCHIICLIPINDLEMSGLAEAFQLSIWKKRFAKLLLNYVDFVKTLRQVVTGCSSTTTTVGQLIIRILS